MYDRVNLAADTVRVLNLRTELVSAIADVKNIRKAAMDLLEDPRRAGRLNLSRRSALDAAKLLLQASDRLDKHLRMLGDLTGEFRQAQRNPRDIGNRLYNEWIGQFVTLWQSIDPRITRRQIVETLADMPETAGELMPFVQAELLAAGT